MNIATYASVHLSPEPGGSCTVFLYDHKGGKRLSTITVPEHLLADELAGYTVETTECDPLVSRVRTQTRPRPFPYIDYRPINLAERRALAGM